MSLTGPAHQGEYRVVGGAGGKLAGADVGSLLTVLPTSVPGWGSCVTKYGRAVLLRSSSSCYRCVWLELRSRSVLQVHQAAQRGL